MRRWLKSHHDTLFPFFPYLRKRDLSWFLDQLEKRGGGRGALYIHIPFCIGRCTFCILTREQPSSTMKYVETLLAEAAEWSDYFSPVETVYVGGGTPTLLSSEELNRLFDGLKDTFRIEKNAEISVETTVSELTEEKMSLLAKLGVNRLSIGVQTFNPSLREVLGRRSNPETVIEKLKAARAVFPTLTVDILYNFPGPNKNVVISDLEQALELGVDGISLYPLIYGRKTAISKLDPPGISDAMDAFIDAKNVLEEHGYTQMNINHFSNGRDKFLYSTYFNNLKPVLGLGAGAMGFLASCFLKHKLSARKYIMDRKTTIHCLPEPIIPLLWCVSQVQYGRIDVREVRDRWGFDPLRAFQKTFTECKELGEISVEDDLIEFTAKGLFWADTIGAQMASEYLYGSRARLISLEDPPSRIMKNMLLNVIKAKIQGREKLKVDGRHLEVLYGGDEER